MTDLAAIAAAFLVVTVTPGPANIGCATVAMKAGRGPGVLFAIGLTLGMLAWGLVAITGMGAILQTSAVALAALKIVGGAYLLWLAYQSGRAALKGEEDAKRDPGNGLWFRRGLFLNLSNPKAVIAWMAALSMGFAGGEGTAQLIAAFVMCMAIGTANYFAHALLFSLPGAMAAYRRAGRWINGAVAALFSAGGFGLIRSAFVR